MKDLTNEVMKKVLDEDYPKPIWIKNLGLMYPTEKSRQKIRYGLYKCGFCGNEFKACIYAVNSGNTKSCGCYKKRRASELNKTHGLGYSRLCAVWASIKDRVLNPKH